MSVDECAQGDFGVGLFHEGFADEHSVDAVGFEFEGVLVCADARFADKDGEVGHVVDEVDGVIEVGGHGAQVAVVDAEQAAAGVGGDHGLDAVEVFAVVDFDKDGEVLVGG